MAVLLNCEKLGFGYGSKNFATDLNFELLAGEVVALMGENGSGKSTLLKTLCGQIPTLSGTVLVQMNSSLQHCDPAMSNLGDVPARDLARRVALVRMSGIAPDRMTVREFVNLGRSPYAGLFDGRSAEDNRIVEEAIALLELESFADRQVSTLSDGERSRVYLAEAVAQQVQILLLDEPNAFLDIPRSHKLFKLLRKLAAEKNMGIVVSTHSVEYAERYCDRLMVIHDGCVQVSRACEARQKGLLNWTEC
ncbi:MAG: ABC transporter ATP-binding protein [Fibrobacter sp.]|nr:ABC transporter ATP-binding protein [Fibrobacter sp.]